MPPHRSVPGRRLFQPALLAYLGLKEKLAYRMLLALAKVAHALQAVLGAQPEELPEPQHVLSNEKAREAFKRKIQTLLFIRRHFRPHPRAAPCTAKEEGVIAIPPVPPVPSPTLEAVQVEPRPPTANVNEDALKAAIPQQNDRPTAWGLPTLESCLKVSYQGCLLPPPPPPYAASGPLAIEQGPFSALFAKGKPLKGKHVDVLPKALSGGLWALIRGTQPAYLADAVLHQAFSNAEETASKGPAATSLATRLGLLVLSPKEAGDLEIVARGIQIDRAKAGLQAEDPERFPLSLGSSLIKVLEEESRAACLLASEPKHPAEKFLRGLLEVPQAKDRLKAMLLAADLDTSQELLATKAACLTAYSQAILGSQALRVIANDLLYITCFANQGRARCHASGLRLAWMAENTWAARLVTRRLDIERSLVLDAEGITMDGLLAELEVHRLLVGALAELKSCHVLTAQQSLTSLDATIKTCHQLTAGLMAYFGVDLEDKEETGAFPSDLHTFIVKFLR